MFDWITAVIAALGAPGVAALTFLENLFPPIPSELVIPLAGFAAARGDLSLAAVIGAGSFGSLAGAAVWYEAGRKIGEPRLRRWVARRGKWITLTERDLDRAQAWFDRHGSLAVFLGRLIPGVRTFVSLPAGFASMRRVPFLAWSAVGTAIWTTVLATAGALLQANYTRVSGIVDTMATGVLLVFAALLIQRYVRCWRASARVRA